MAARRLEIVIAGDSRGAVSAISQVDSRLSGLGRAITAPTRAISGLVTGLGRIGLASIGISALANAFTSPIGAASDLSESVNKLNVVLGDSAQGVLDWASTSAQSLGQSKQQAIAAAAGFSNLFVTMGKGQGEAADLSMDIVALASDLASFNNMTVDESLEKLRAGLVGETEPLRSLGVNINAAAVEAEGLALGLVSAGQEMTDAQKVTARYSLIMKQTATAHGDFAETSTGLANAQRIISASFQDISAQIGGRLLPLVAPLVSGFATSLPAAMQTLTGVLDSVGAAFGTVSGAVQSFLKYLSPANDYDLMGNLFGPDFGPLIDTVIRSLKDAGGAILAIGGTIKDLITGDVDLAGFFGKIGDALGDLGAAIFTGDLAAIDIVGLLLGDAAEAAGKLATKIGEIVGGIDLGAAWESVKAVAVDLAGKLGMAAGSIQIWIGERLGEIDLGAAWESVKAVTVDIVGKLGLAASSVQTWIGERLASIDLGVAWESVKAVAVDLAGKLGLGVAAVQTWINERLGEIKLDTAWESVKAVTVDVAGKLTLAAGAVAGWLGEQWAALTATDWGAIWGNVQNVAAGIGAGLGSIATDIAAWLSQQWAALTTTDWGMIWSSVQNVASGVAAGLGSILEDVTTWLNATWSSISWPEIWAHVTEFVSSAAAFLQANLRTAFTQIRWADVTAGSGPGLLAALHAEQEANPPFMSREWAARLRADIGETLGSANIGEIIRVWWLGVFETGLDFGAIAGKLIAGLGGLAGPITTGVGVFLATLATALTSVEIFFAGLFKGVLEGLADNTPWVVAGNSIVMGLLSGIGGAWNAVSEWWTNAVNGLIAFVRGLFGANSPSTVFMAIGEDVVNGLVAGLAGLPGAIGDAIVSIVTTIAGAAGTVLAGALVLGQNIVAGLVAGATTLAAALTTILTSITGWIASTAATVLATATTIGSSLVTGLQTGAATLAATLAAILGEITGWIGSTAATVLTTATTIGSNLVAAIESGAASLAGTLAGVWATISGWISDSATSALSAASAIGSSLGQGLIDGINGMIDAVRAKADELASAAIGAIVGIVQPGSPSKVTTRLGRDIAAGLVVGMEDRLRDVLTASTALGSAALAGIDATIGNRLGRFGGSDIAWANPTGVPLQQTPVNDDLYWGMRQGSSSQTGTTTVNNYNATINTQATHVDVPGEFRHMVARHGGRY